MGVAHCIVDDVAEEALQVIGVAEGVHDGRRVEVDVETVGRSVGDDVSQECAHVHPLLLSR
jgi:hypothetical protein